MSPLTDFITLLGPKEKYTYQVRYMNGEALLANSGDSAKTTPVNTQILNESQPTEGHDGSSNAHANGSHGGQDEEQKRETEKLEDKEVIANVNKHKNLLTSLECPICFSSFALTHNVVPCGHSFCYECIHDWKGKSNLCPTCSGPIESLMPNFIADQTLQELYVNDADSLAELDGRAKTGMELKKGISCTSKSNQMKSSPSKKRKSLSTASITRIFANGSDKSIPSSDVIIDITSKKTKKTNISSSSSSSSSKQVVEILEDDVITVDTTNGNNTNRDRRNGNGQMNVVMNNLTKTNSLQNSPPQRCASTATEILDLTLDE